MSGIDSRVKVAQDLREIENLYEALLVQAVHKAGDRLMPGGEAMVALGPVASPDAWAEVQAAEERYHLRACSKLDHTRCHFGPAEHGDDDGEEPPLQTLLFWSEDWRSQHGYALDRRPTITTEANFIRGNLDWAWENEPHWDDFTKDIKRARVRLENLLLAGERSERGTPCMYDECRGVRLVRKLVPARGPHGEKVWRLTDWHCPKCKRTWDEDAYARLTAAGAWRAQREDVNGETWCSTRFAAQVIGRPEATVRAWVTYTRNPRGDRDRDYPIATVCITRGRRVGFVRLVDVLRRHEASGRRAVA